MYILISVLSSLFTSKRKIIPFITVRDKLCWKIPLYLFSLALDKGLPAPGDAEVLPHLGSEYLFPFKSTDLIPSRSCWSPQDSEADVNLPPWSLCWLHRMFSCHFHLECSINVFLLYWEIIVLPLKGWPLAWKEGWCTTIIMDIFSRRVGLSVCFHALE